MALFIAHLVLAQLTLVLAIAFVVVNKASRWRLWWLLAPAAAGLAWALAIGPDQALAGFTAGPSSILWHLDGGHLAGAVGHPFAGFSGARNWLPRQFPVALIAGAAEAALAGWLDWLHTDEWAVPPPRPGLIAATRRALGAHLIRAGAVATQDGCALGVVPATGAVAELRWAELARGALVVGAAQQDVTLTGLQVVHAALRRRKPVLVLDLADAAVARALTVACLATETPLLTGGAGNPGQIAPGTGIPNRAELAAAGASQLWGRGTAPESGAAGREHPITLPPEVSPEPAGQAAVDLGWVVRERLAALLPAGSAELVSRACADLASLAADLRRIGVDGDALVWVPHGERVPVQELGALLRGGPDTGLSILIGTTSPQTATELSALVGTTLAYRVTDRGLADVLAAGTGTRLLPPPIAARLAGSRPVAEPPTPYAARGFAPEAAVAPDLVPGPVLPTRALLSLGQTEFVLAASSPRQRLIANGKMVPSRLPVRPQ